MQLEIRHRIINTAIDVILARVREELNDGRLRSIKVKRDNVVCTCPFHKNGFEKKPSMNIYCGDSSNVEYGIAHCFTCDYKAPLPKLIADIFDEPPAFGEDWLLERFAGDFVEELPSLPPIETIPAPTRKILDPAILSKYKYKHPYMYQRGLTDAIIDYFQIGYNPDRDTITFPVWDECNQLVAITERSVKTKNFYIPEDIEKPVYLLNVVKALKSNTVAVCESQLNTLNTWKWGYPAVGLFGTGSTHQLDLLKKSGVRHFVLLFDGDDAGRRGASKFKEAMPDDILITDVHMYWGKDVSDLTAEEFYALMKRYNL